VGQEKELIECLRSAREWILDLKGLESCEPEAFKSLIREYPEIVSLLEDIESLCGFVHGIEE